MINTAIERTKARKHFFGNIYHKELAILAVFLVISILLVAMIMYSFIFTHQKIPDFYASSADGLLTPLNAMAAPNVSDKPLLE